VKEKDVILTSDYWKIIVNFDLMPYEDVVSTLREDLRELKEASKRSLPIGELRYVVSTKRRGNQVSRLERIFAKS
jgi:hypothetical protein